MHILCPKAMKLYMKQTDFETGFFAMLQTLYQIQIQTQMLMPDLKICL
jgi:hypothetical protein